MVSLILHWFTQMQNKTSLEGDSGEFLELF